MKIGVRKPNLKSRVKARTTGKLKRKAKKAVNPLYGKKGMGWVKDPKKAMYNKVYNKTSVSVDDLVKAPKSKQKKGEKPVPKPTTSPTPEKANEDNSWKLGCLVIMFIILILWYGCSAVVNIATKSEYQIQYEEKGSTITAEPNSIAVQG